MNIKFNFALAPVNKKQNNKSTKTTPSKLKNIKGVVWIDLEANYFVRVKDIHGKSKDYPITKSSYSCKDKESVFKFNENNSKILLWFRHEFEKINLNYKWKPFAPGVIVDGYIVKYNDKEYIEILNTDITTLTSDGSEAKAFYLENHKIIKENFEIKYGNGEQSIPSTGEQE